MWTVSCIRRGSLALIAFALVAAHAPANAQGEDAPPDPFAGEWAVHATPDRNAFRDGQNAFDEAVLFHQGQFSAAVFAMFGFAPSTYAVDNGGSQPEFTVLLPSTDRGSLQWTGRPTPTGIEGVLLWQHADGSTDRYTFTGERPAED